MKRRTTTSTKRNKMPTTCTEESTHHSFLGCKQSHRVQDAFASSRICVTDITTDEETGAFVLIVSGDWSKSYRIVIPTNGTDHITCSCPDSYRRTFVCKHRIKVLSSLGLIQFTATSWVAREYNYVKTMRTTSPTSTIIESLGEAGDKKIVLNEEEVSRVISLFNRRIESGPSVTSRPSLSTKKVIEHAAEDPCAICFEDITAGETVFECKTCKKTIHDACWTQWKMAGRRSCVYCRTEA